MLWESVDEQPFIDLLWDNMIEDGVAFHRKRKEEDPDAFVFRAEALACQAVRSFRDGAPEVAVQAVELALEEYPGHALAERLLREFRAGSTNARSTIPHPGSGEDVTAFSPSSQPPRRGSSVKSPKAGV